MKKIILPLIILSTSLVFGQSIQLINATTKVVVDGKVSPTALTFGVKNISTDTVYFIAAKETISAIAGTSNYFCWDACLSPNVDTAGELMIAPNATINNFIGDYVHNGAVGTTVVKYTFFNRDSILDKIELTVSYENETTDGITNNSLVKAFKLSPNPVRGVFSINYQFNTQEKNIFKVYDILGNQILATELNEISGFKTFDVSKLDAGIYFYTVSNNNMLLKTEKFVISK